MANNPRVTLVAASERLGVVLLLAALSGCGVETATTAATGASIKAKELEEAKKTQERARQKIEQATQQTEQRARDDAK